MKINDIYVLKSKLEKAEKIRDSVNEIDIIIKLLNDFGSKITKINMSYTTMGVHPFSPSGEEELLDVTKEIDTECLGVKKDEFSQYFKESVLLGLISMKEELLKELERM